MLTQQEELTILLSSVHDAFSIEFLAQDLCCRNEGLYGQIAVIRCRTFGAAEKTRDGRSMLGWRLVYLRPDKEFLDCLRDFRKDHKFNLGSGTVTMRGGVRRLPTAAEVMADQYQQLTPQM